MCVKISKNLILRMKCEWGKANKVAVIVGAAIVLFFGILSVILTKLLGGNFLLYSFIRLPAIAPPRFIFGLVWTILYLCIGGAAGTVMCCQERFCEVEKYKGLFLFVIMMLFNILWCPLFFAAMSFFLALIDIIAMLALTLLVIYYFSKVCYLSAAAMIVYLIWLLYSFILNFSIVLMN